MNNHRLFRRMTAALLVFSFALGTATYAFAVSQSAQADDVRKLLEQYHLSKPTDATLDNAAIQGMIDSLHDPYTQYFTDDQLKQFTNDIEQTFVGIGIVMAEDNGSVYIEDVISGSPSAQAGLLSGDRIVSAGGRSLVGKSTAEIQQATLGKEGTTLVLGIDRNGAKLQFKVVRKTVQMPVSLGKYMGEGIGYVELDSFSSDAGDQFAAQLAKLDKSNLHGLVIDLRNNGGGYVDQAQKIAALFIKDGILAHMKDRDGNDTPIPVHGQSKPYQVWILVNDGTASASELLSGALRDYNVAKLVGTTTYGKGVVQQLIPVPSGGTLKVTVQEYFTPNGHAVNKVGLKPDLKAEGAAQQLIAAYRAAGGRQLSLHAGKGAVVVNGVKNAQSESVLKLGGVWFLNARLGASAADALIQYDAKSKAIVFTRGTQKNSLSAKDTHLIIRDGASFIDVRELSKWYADVHWSASGDGTLALGDSQ